MVCRQLSDPMHWEKPITNFLGWVLLVQDAPRKQHNKTKEKKLKFFTGSKGILINMLL
jgi:hypothetical protein